MIQHIYLSTNCLLHLERSRDLTMWLRLSVLLCRRGEERDNCYQPSWHITALTEWGSWELQPEIRGNRSRHLHHWSMVDWNIHLMFKRYISVFLSNYLFYLLPLRPCRLPAWSRRFPQGSLRIHKKKSLKAESFQYNEEIWWIENVVKGKSVYLYCLWLL